MRNLLFVPGCTAALVGGYSAMDHTPTFPVPIEQAYAKLHATRFSNELGSVSMRKSAISEYVDGVTGKSLTWSLGMDGYSLGRIEAKLTPDGTRGTKVAIDFKAAQSGPLMKLGQFVQDDGLMHAGLQEMLEERVAASLEDRAFDEHRVETAIRWYAGTHPWEVTNLQVKIQALQTDPGVAKDLFGDMETSEGASTDRVSTRAGAPMIRPEERLREQQWETERKMREAAAPTAPVYDQ